MPKNKLKKNPPAGYRWIESYGRSGYIYCQGSDIYGKVYPLGIIVNDERFNAVVVELSRANNSWQEISIGYYRRLYDAQIAVETRVHGYMTM